MANHAKFTSAEAELAERILAGSKPDMLGAAILRIVHICGTTIEAAAEAVGVSRATAIRYLAKFAARFKSGAAAESKHGGRRNELLSRAEEKVFLAEWHARAENGELVTIAPLTAALEARIGRPVSDVSIYNMLKRNHWRKLMPDTRHPQQDLEKQEEFKKNCRKSWRAPG
ncbi:MAG: winged helix-turn-helix domain-containing protein [Lentisphaeria bacterium]|jgi:transposase